MPEVPKLANSVLTKTQRQLARELAYRLLEQGYAAPVVREYVALQFSVDVDTIRKTVRRMAKPLQRSISHDLSKIA